MAFNALPVLEIELDGETVQVQHLGLVMVDPDARCKGMSWALYGLTCFLLFFRDRGRPMWISNVTQVPAVMGMVAETFSEVYPDPASGTRKRFAHLQVARQIVRRHYQAFGVAPDVEFDETAFVLRDAYTGGSDHLKKSFDGAPKHRNDVFNHWCRDSLDYDRGNDVIQIGRIDLATARRYITKAVPGKLIGPLLAHSLILLLQHATLPVLHRVDNSKRFGRLRP